MKPIALLKPIKNASNSGKERVKEMVQLKKIYQQSCKGIYPCEECELWFSVIVWELF